MRYFMQTNGFTPSPSMPITFKILDAKTFPNYLDAIVDLRIKAFSQFPYLFARRNKEMDKAYLTGYMTHPDGRMMVFCDENDHVIAMCAGSPLNHDLGQSCSLTGCFLDRLPWSKEKIQQSYYVGDVIVHKDYQDASVLRQLVQYGEKTLAECGYRYVTFITADHPKNHPMRPKGYRDLNDKLGLLGYEKIDVSLSATYDTYQPDGSHREQENPLAFWVKDLQVAPSLLRQAERHMIRLREKVASL